MILYYITDRRQLASSEDKRRHRLLDKISEAADAGVDHIQLREKDLSARDLETLARESAALVRRARMKGSRTKLLINARSDVALATAADGVHLPAGDIPAGDVRALWMSAQPIPPVIAVSCHSVEEVRMAESQGADFAVFAPVFGKTVLRASSIAGMEYETVLPGIGLESLSKACGVQPAPENTEAAPFAARFPVLALGGITIENAAQCIAAGAAGIAGIRLFQENDIEEVVSQLRGE